MEYPALIIFLVEVILLINNLTIIKAIYFLLVGAGIFLLVYKNRPGLQLITYFLPLLLLCLFTEAARTFSPGENLLTQYFFSLYTPAEYTILCTFYASVITNNRVNKIIYFTIPLFITFSLITQFQLDSTNYFYRYLDVLVEAPLMVTWIVFFFFQLFRDDTTYEFSQKATFWISAGNLLFFAGSFFSYAFKAFLFNHNQDELGEAIGWISRSFNLILYSSYIIAFLCPRM